MTPLHASVNSWPMIFYFITFLQSITTTTAAADSDHTKKEPNMAQYFYVEEKDCPIHEVVASYNEEGNYQLPPFLTDLAQYPRARIVEFYADWCPHCKHFKPQYIQFGKQLQQAVQEEFGTEEVLVETMAVSCVPHKKACRQFHVGGYPMVQYFEPYAVNGTKLNVWDLHPKTIIEKIRRSQEEQPFANHNTTGKVAPLLSYGHHDHQEGEAIESHSSLSVAKGDSPYFSHRSKQEVYHDAHLSLDFVLRNGVFVAANTMTTNNQADSPQDDSTSPLTPQARSVLQQFLTLLQQTVPQSSTMTQDLLEDLMAVPTEKKQESLFRTLTNGGESKFLTFLDLHPSPTETWSSACMQHGTGYTCGLWQLFHIVSIGVVEWNRFASGPSQLLAPAAVAETIRSFVDHFFQCDDCRMHFLTDYDNCAYDRCQRLIGKQQREEATITDWKELSLWLYETHNGVNSRLRLERIENKEEESTLTTPWQVQWPSIDDCSDCWLSEGRWDEDRIYDFLKSTYWPSRHDKEDNLNVKHSAMNRIDALPASAALRSTMDTGNNYKNGRGNVSTATTDVSFMDGFLRWESAVVVLLVVGVLVWFQIRKRQYDRKGYSKKHEQP